MDETYKAIVENRVDTTKRLFEKVTKLMYKANNINKVYKVYRHVRVWIYCQWAYAGAISHEEHDTLVREISEIRDIALKKFR